MKNLIFLLLITVSFSCNYSANKKPDKQIYTKDGLSFELPKYWEVEKDRPIDGVADSRFITVSNKEPFADDSYFVLTAVKSANNLRFTLNNLIKQSRISFSKRKMQFGLLGQAKPFVFGQHKVLRVGFETKVIATRNKGSFSVFDYAGKTYSVVGSAEFKDSKENTAVVDAVIKSLKIN
ncbi:hypothetical protein [Pedobacter namyangjuensis]|uniref:hypothetical protein n=1 Tax=Pedobacter namyangjuensis TaxID=600626 RepID=UPI0013B40EC2|nr:hypothetical protein [Pedobacter namyangjuensis]